MRDDPVERLVGRLRTTAKYRGLCDEVLGWAARDALGKTRSEKEALKAAKRKLHQAFGSFVDASRRKAVLASLDAARAASSRDEANHALWVALGLHASTAERRSHHDTLWSTIRDAAGPMASILDLGCGLAPAALPWSGLPTEVSYEGMDLDETLCAGLDAALRPWFPAVRVHAAEIRTCRLPSADCALMWKLLPTLERQATGAARALVERLDVGVLVATFPTRSLTGRDRGMADQYRHLADAVMGEGEEYEIGDELVRIVTR